MIGEGAYKVVGVEAPTVVDATWELVLERCFDREPSTISTTIRATTIKKQAKVRTR